jgi:hypothetical protein
MLEPYMPLNRMNLFYLEKLFRFVHEQAEQSADD